MTAMKKLIGYFVLASVFLIPCIMLAINHGWIFLVCTISASLVSSALFLFAIHLITSGNE